MNKIDYYDCLGLTKTASHQEVKQSYRKLALKYHPDKNQDKQQAKIKFTQITQAYTVLNDPQKRKNYDQFGVTDNQFAQFSEFQQFMGDFGLFQEFLDDFLAFDQMAQMTKMFSMMMGKSSKKGGSRRKRGGKGPSMSQMNKAYQQLFKFMEQAEEQEDEDQQQLTPEQLLILQFGKKNTQKKKVGKKRKLLCKFCETKMPQDEVLLHFSDLHMKQFNQWKNAKGNPESNEKQKIIS